MKINGYDVEDGIVKAVFITDLKRDLKMARFEMERPHGEWIWKEWDTPMSKISYCKCSVCGIGMGNTEYDFCPNCGADMRKEGEAE